MTLYNERFEGKRPLEFLLAFHSPIEFFSLCKYDVEENYQIYRRHRVYCHKSMLLQTYQELRKEVEGTGEEVGLCSSSLTLGGEERHLTFADMADGADPRRVMGDDTFLAVRSSDANFHLYGTLTHSNYWDVTSQLLQIPTFIDMKWLRCGQQRGFNVLRLSRATPRFADQPVLKLTMNP